MSRLRKLNGKTLAKKTLIFILAMLIDAGIASAYSNLAPLDPEDLGQDLPPVGSSLFDKMFSKGEGDNAVYDVPYPFEAFIERINGRATEDLMKTGEIDPGSFFMDSSEFDIDPLINDFNRLPEQLGGVAKALRKRIEFHNKRMAILYNMSMEQRQSVLGDELGSLLNRQKERVAHDDVLFGKLLNEVNSNLESQKASGTGESISGFKFLAVMAGKLKIKGKYISNDREKLIIIGANKNPLFAPFLQAKADNNNLDFEKSFSVIRTAQSRGLSVSADLLKMSEQVCCIDIEVLDDSDEEILKKLAKIAQQTTAYTQILNSAGVTDPEEIVLSRQTLLEMNKELAESNSDDAFMTLVSDVFSSEQFPIEIETVESLLDRWRAQLLAEMDDLQQIFYHINDQAPEGSNFLQKVRNVKTMDQLLSFLRLDIDDMVEPFMNQTFFPFGRSLQKPVSPAFNPFDYPRHLVRGENSEYWRSRVGLVKNRIFCGHLKPKRSIECISYNDEAGRFEFQIITDYHNEGKIPMPPQVHYIKRKVCTACHQNQGPIFPRFPWSESDDNVILHSGLIMANYNGKGKESIAENSQAFNDALNERIKKRASISRTEGLDVNFKKTRAGRYDLAVDEANKMLRFQKLWIHYCGSSDSGNECRADVMKLVVALAISDQAVGSEILFRWVDQQTNLRSIMNQGNIEKGRLLERNPFLDPGQPDRDPLIPLLREGDINKVDMQNCILGLCDINFIQKLIGVKELWSKIITSGRYLFYARDPKKFRPFTFELGSAFASSLSEQILRFIDKDDLGLLVDEYLEKFNSLETIKGTIAFHNSIGRGDKKGMRILISGPIYHSQGHESLYEVFENDKEVNEAMFKHGVISRFPLQFAKQEDGREYTFKMIINEMDPNSFAESTLSINGQQYKMYCYMTNRAGLEIGGFFGVEPALNIECAQYDPFHVFRIIDHISQVSYGPLGARPFHRERFMEAFLNEIGSEKASQFSFFRNHPKPPQKLVEETYLPPKPPLRYFSIYCGNCHSGMNKWPPNFMRATTEQELNGNIKKWASDISFQMTIGMMPEGNIKIPKEHEKAMLDYLDNLGKESK